MVQRLKNAVFIHREIKKIHQKEAGCIIFTHQDFHNGDAPIELYALEQWCKITTEDVRELLFSGGTLEECMEESEADYMGVVPSPDEKMYLVAINITR